MTSALVSIQFRCHMGLDGNVTWNVEPDQAGQSAAVQDDLGPQSSAFIVPFKTRGCPIRNNKAKAVELYVLETKLRRQ